MNKLYYGDNLQILREYVQDESVDLIYLDPPFNSNRNYNVLFKNENGTDSEAQITAFEDTWHWDYTAENTYQELITDAPEQISRMTGALREFIGANQMMAYLVMMTVRLIELHRVLKDIGSLYLHCDSTVSHYLKIVLDTIFGGQNFINEIIWKRTSAHNTTSRKLGDITDTILFYGKTNKYFFNSPRQPHDETYIKKFYKHKDANGRPYRLHLVERNPALGVRPNLIYEYKGYTPKYGWMMELKKLEWLNKQNKLHWSSNNRPSRKIFLDEVKKPPCGNLWDDILPIQAQAAERLGYPTQKPLALLERIIKASSNEGDTILDPFCGCGTAIHAAEKLKRQWIGIDITHLSTSLLKYRLKDAFDLSEKKDYKVIGEPQDLASAEQLALSSRYQFQWWALSLVQAKPLGGKKGSKKGKKGSDGGIDGVIAFIDDQSKKPKRILVQVKSGKVSVRDIRDLIGTVEREKAAIGVFITLESSTKPMNKEAILAGVYHSPGWHKDYPKIQILSIEQLLNSKEIQMPPARATFKKAKKEGKGMKQIGLVP